MLPFSLVLLLDKPKGLTSHTAIKQVQRSLECKSIGHCGTLDKFASGLLIVLLNRATRLSQFFLKLPKVYVAEIFFGKCSDTLDPESEAKGSARVPTLKEIEKVLSKHFIGCIMQSPPLYSAVHVNGERAWKRARKGEQFCMPQREVEIYSYSILSYTAATLKIQLHVSSGTYIRAIARDLAEYCNSLAYVQNLRRMSIADFTVDKASGLSAITDQPSFYKTAASQLIYAMQKKGTSTEAKIVKQPSCFILPDIALEKIHIMNRLYTEDTTIREELSRGIMPSLIQASSPSTESDIDSNIELGIDKFTSIHDSDGLVGIWKTSPECKLLFYM